MERSDSDPRRLILSARMVGALQALRVPGPVDLVAFLGVWKELPLKRKTECHIPALPVAGA